MGSNSRDRNFEATALARMREVRRLDQQGRALHLVITGSKAFNDRAYVARVLDRLHAERGIACLSWCTSIRATLFAHRWAELHYCRSHWVLRAQILAQRPLHGVVAFDGPDAFVATARANGIPVWRLTPPS